MNLPEQANKSFVVMEYQGYSDYFFTKRELAAEFFKRVRKEFNECRMIDVWTVRVNY